MIQEYFKSIAEFTYPNFVWSADYYLEEDNTGTIFYEGGGQPSTNDLGLRYPSYMIMLRSSNWEVVEDTAESLLTTFHLAQNQSFTTSRGKTYEIIYIEAQGEPIRLGVINGKMEYTINFNCTLREVTNNA
jgi:hypothetical protein